MTDSDRLNEEITFLSDEISSLKVRIAANENAARCDASRRTEDASAKWLRTKAENAEIRRRRA